MEEFEKLKSDKAKYLSKEDWFKAYFDVKGQSTKVFKDLADTRSWKEKAKIVGLEKEYSINYERSSSLLHFTAYSIITSSTISQEEIDYNYILINQYIKKISENISAFTKAIILDICETVIKV